MQDQGDDMMATDFDIYPAIDLRNGEVVRLRQGDPARQTTYNRDPAASAQAWAQAGARWLHVVNLDGALEADPTRNLAALAQVVAAAAALGVKVQFGGGVRSLEAIAAALDLGVTRLILGTAAAQDPEMAAQAVSRFGPESIGVGIDARDGQVKIRGWQQAVPLTPIDLGTRMAGCGVQTLVYTNIARDGVGTGVDVEGTAALAEASGLAVIASGGVASLEDVRLVRAAGLPGVIIGRALYEGEIDLKEALAC